LNSDTILVLSTQSLRFSVKSNINGYFVRKFSLLYILQPSYSKTTLFSNALSVSLCDFHSVRPPPLTSTSDQPPLFDGTTRFSRIHFLFMVLLQFSDVKSSPFYHFLRLYTSYGCPYAQRVWITRNYKVLSSNFLCLVYNILLICLILMLLTHTIGATRQDQIGPYWSSR